MVAVSDQLTSPETWVDRYADEMMGYAFRRLRDRSAAEDAVQTAFLSAFKSLEQFSGKSSEKTWLFSILKNKCIDMLRKSSREKQTGNPSDDYDIEEVMFDNSGHFKSNPGKWSMTEDTVSQKEFWQTFDQCFDKLPQRIGQAFALREIDGESSEMVCEVLDISRDNLWTMLHRARLQLRECLEQNWFDKKK